MVREACPKQKILAAVRYGGLIRVLETRKDRVPSKHETPKVAKAFPLQPCVNSSRLHFIDNGKASILLICLFIWLVDFCSAEN